MVGTLLHAIGIAVQLTLLLGVVLAVGCDHLGGDEPEPRGRRDPATRGDARRGDAPRDDAPRPAVPPYEPITVVNGGTITGTVSWSGELPELAPIAVSTHREACGETQRPPVLEVDRRGGVAGTVVWLDAVRRGRAAVVPAEPVEVVVEGCRFRPHVIAVPVGARVAFRNADPVLHNVRGAPWRLGAIARGAEDGVFSRGLPEAGSVEEVTIERTGLVRLVDDAAHPWMLAWIHAFEHPYFAVSDAAGHFQIVGIPTGQYTLRAWHEGIRPTGATEAGRPVYSSPIVLTRPIAVQSGHDSTVDFVITPEAAEAAGG